MRAEDKPAARDLGAEAKAAKSAYDGYAKWQAAEPDKVDADGLYRWSLRWAQAEAAGGKPKDAYAAHLERMTKLATAREKAVKSGEASKVELSAVQFYLAEAERLAK